MKKILHSVVLLGLILVVSNAHARIKLSVSVTTPTAIKVIIDGQKFFSQDNNMSIYNLQPGYHQVTVYYIKNRRDFTSYYNSGNNTYWKKVVSRQVTVRNNYQYDITVNRFGKAFYDQDFMYDDNNDDDNWYYNDDDDNNCNYFDYNNGYNQDYNDWDFFRKKGTNPVNSTIDNHYSNHSATQNSHNNSYNNYYGKKVMSAPMFAQIKSTIQQQTMETSKLDFAKQSIVGYYVSTQQVKDLMGLLSMEIDKLDFAKYAYDYIIDKQNYMSVTNSLSMQEDRDDLLKFIKDKK